MRFFPRNRASRHDALIGPNHVARHPHADSLTERDRVARYSRGNGGVVAATGNAHACNESDIVTGGKILTLTLTGDDLWQADLITARSAVLLTAFPTTDGLRAALSAGNFSLNAARTVLTLTLPAIGAYVLSTNASYDLSFANSLFQHANVAVPVVAAIVVTHGA